MASLNLIHPPQEPLSAVVPPVRWGGRTRNDAPILPMYWDWYHASSEGVRVLREVGRRIRAGVPPIVFARGDLEPVLPFAAVLFHPGIHASRHPESTAFATPYFFADRAAGVVIREKRARPTIGFCGQAAHRPLVEGLLTARRATRKIIDRKNVHPGLRSHVSLRRRALQVCVDADVVETEFVVRDRYRAGASSADAKVASTKEFDDNLGRSDYVICVRGTGNFSARFYEALSFGRIPVFVNTDCRLPFDFSIDWTEHVVWVERSEIAEIPTRVAAHYESLNDAAFRSLQQANRELWLDRLTPQGFATHFEEHPV